MTRKPIATMTVIRNNDEQQSIIHGRGECETIMYDVAMKEMTKMNERLKREMSTLRCELESSRNHEYDLLARDLTDLRVRLAKPTSRFERFVDKVETAWCVFVGTIMELGSITYVRSSEEDI